MNDQAPKFVPKAIVGILERINGLDYDVGPHKNPKTVIYRSGPFCKYLKIDDESTIDILTYSCVLHLKKYEGFES